MPWLRTFLSVCQSQWCSQQGVHLPLHVSLLCFLAIQCLFSAGSISKHALQVLSAALSLTSKTATAVVPFNWVSCSRHRKMRGPFYHFPQSPATSQSLQSRHCQNPLHMPYYHYHQTLFPLFGTFFGWILPFLLQDPYGMPHLRSRPSF